MCTAILIKGNDKYFFGRNMDIQRDFRQRLIRLDKMTGIGTYIDNIPLFADGVNKDGLAICGLNFRGYAQFQNTNEGIPSWNFIRWVLYNNKSVSDLRKNIQSVIISDVPVNKETPIPTLHWIVADKTGECTVIECVKGEIRIYDNPCHVLTNNPTFPEHLQNLKNQDFSKMKNLPKGDPSLTLPGDFSSVSRFLKVSYLIKNLPHLKTDEEAINHFFDILGSVKMLKGCVLTDMRTIYSCCIDLNKGEYVRIINN